MAPAQHPEPAIAALGAPATCYGTPCPGIEYGVPRTCPANSQRCRRSAVEGLVMAGLRLVVLCLASLAGAAIGGEPRNGPLPTVALNIPYKTVLRAENVQFTVVLRNGAKTSLPYIAEPAKAAARQVFMRVERGVRDYTGPWHVDGPLNFPGFRVRTVEKDGHWDAVLEAATALLRPGGTVEWDGSRFSELLFYVTEGMPKSIQAQVLIGPGRWVASDPVPIKIINKELEQFPVVFENVYAVGPRKVRRPARIRRVQIEGEDYLFTDGGGRICGVPRGCTPKFIWEPDAGLLTVHFPGTRVPPVLYNYRQMQVIRPPPL